MLATHYSWLWLNTIAINYCQSILSQCKVSPCPFQPGDWLGRLAYSVANSLWNFKPWSMLERKEFLPSLPPLSTRIPEPHVTPELTIEAHIIQLIYTTLRTWLSYPTTPTSLIQGTFIQILITAFKTSDILLHDGIWDVFIQPMKAFFPVHLHRQTTLNASDLQPFHNALMSIPACHYRCHITRQSRTATLLGRSPVPPCLILEP